MGLEPRLPVKAAQVFQFREEFIRERNLIAWSLFNPIHPIEVVDILLTENLSLIKTVTVKAGGRKLPVASIADLVTMKKKSARPQDLADIQALNALRKALK